MNETQVSIAGIIFLISTLCACGSGSGNPAADKLLAQAQQTSQNAENGGGGNGQAGSHGKGKGAGKAGQGAADSGQDLVAGAVDEETCDAGRVTDPSTVILCDVGTGRQVCTDVSTALSKYGLDPSKPNLVASDGDHLGAC